MVVIKIGFSTLLVGGAVLSAVVFKPDRASFERYGQNHFIANLS